MGILRNKGAIKVFYALEKFLCRKAARIIVITEGYKHYIESIGIAGGKISVIPNGADEELLDFVEGSAPPEMEALKGSFVVGYAGAIGKFNYLHYLIEAAEILKDVPQIQFVLVGDGGERNNLRKIVEEKGLTSVHFPGSRKRDEIPAWLSAASIAAIVYPPIPLSRLLLMNKVLDPMSLGKPVILMAEEGDTSRMLEAAEGGFRIDYGADGLAGKIRWCQEHMESCKEKGASARRYVRRHFLRKDLAVKLGEELSSLSPSAPRA